MIFVSLTSLSLFCLSDGALYNIDPTTVKVKRRIQLANISRLSTSLLSDNFFVVHVPLEYDYLFVSGHKTEVISVLRQAFTEATSQELSITMQNMYDSIPQIPNGAVSPNLMIETALSQYWLNVIRNLSNIRGSEH